MSHTRRSKRYDHQKGNRRVRRALNAAVDFYRWIGGRKASSRDYGGGITHRHLRERLYPSSVPERDQ